MKRAVVGVLAALVLAACGGSDEPDDAGTSSSSPSASTEAAPDPLAACALVFDGGETSLFEQIPGALSSIGAQVTQEQTDQLVMIEGQLSNAIELADGELAAALTELNVPFAQFAEVVEAGGGSLELDTASVQTDITTVMQLCRDAGYTVGG